MVEQILGFDFGEKYMKIAVMEGKTVRKTFRVEMPDNVIAAKGQIIAMDAMAELLTKFVKENKLKRELAAVVLPSSQVLTRNLTVPVMTDAQMRFDLPFEFADYLTKDKAEYIFDYEVLDTTEDASGKTQMRVFACATHKQVIEDYRKLFKKAGLKLQIAVPEEYAFARLMQTVQPETKKAVCFVDLGYGFTRIHMIKNGQYDTKRELDYGIKDVISTISETRDMDDRQADTAFVENMLGVQNVNEVYEIYGQISLGIRSSLNFYKSTKNQDSEWMDLYLFGGGALVQPLADVIAEGAPFTIRSCQTLLSGDIGSDFPFFVRAASCALCV